MAARNVLSFSKGTRRTGPRFQPPCAGMSRSGGGQPLARFQNRRGRGGQVHLTRQLQPNIITGEREAVNRVLTKLRAVRRVTDVKGKTRTSPKRKRGRFSLAL